MQTELYTQTYYMPLTPISSETLLEIVDLRETVKFAKVEAQMFRLDRDIWRTRHNVLKNALDYECGGRDRIKAQLEAAREELRIVRRRLERLRSSSFVVVASLVVVIAVVVVAWWVKK